MPLIRDTIDPLREREVPEEEALDLERQGVVLTGTRAKTPEGLRAAAVRQVLQREADVFAATLPARPDVPADDVADEPTEVPADEPVRGGDTETHGADPASTTDDTITPDSPQES